MSSRPARPLEWIGSLRLSVVLLVLLAILTWLGTLEQVDLGLYEVQRRYFDSWFLLHEAWGVPLPLPGARLVMAVLFVNLIVGGVLILRRGWATSGVLVAHVGILFLLVAGLIKAAYAVEGRLSLYEGERTDTFDGYQRWEIALLEKLDDGRVREFTIPEECFARNAGPKAPRFTRAELPFELEVSRWIPNCRVGRKGPMVQTSQPVLEDFFLDPRPLEKQAELNTGGAYVALIAKSGGARSAGILWGDQQQPWGASFDDKSWAVELRHERHWMPFTLGLEKFTKEEHPGMSMAKAFSSDVRVSEAGGARALKISMNQPLREGGLVVYQSSWGPPDARPGTPLFSTLAVVSNPADQYPLYACIVIAVGLALHYGRKLVRHIRAEARHP